MVILIIITMVFITSDYAIVIAINKDYSSDFLNNNNCYYHDFKYTAIIIVEILIMTLLIEIIIDFFIR